MRHIDGNFLAKIGKLNKELDKLKRKLDCLDKSYEHATVMASSRHPPYCQRPIIISGIPSKRIDDAARQATIDYAVKLAELNCLVADCQAYIETLPDADLRLILQGRYIKRLSWHEIAANFGIANSTARWKYNKWRIEQEKSYLNG